MIVVLDTNVLIRAAFRRDLDPDNLVARASRGEFEIATSAPLMAELSRMLSARRLEPYYRWQVGEIEQFLRTLEARARNVEPSVELDVVRDAADNRLIEAAVEAEADYIVSTDRDLLDLVEYAGVQIVTQAQFLAILRTAPL